MAEQDQVTISTASQHTTTLAQMSKEYAALYDLYQSRVKQANDLLAAAEAASSEADKLKPDVEALRDRIHKALDGSAS